MTAATADPFDVLAAFLRQDFGTYDQLVQQVDSEAMAAAFGAAFFLAVDQRFGQEQSISAVIRLVAEARARFDETGDDVDPIAAERLIRSVMFDKPELARGIDQRTIGKAETALLATMAENWDEARLNAFLTESRNAVDGHTAG
jgi:hypothetical protein